MGARGPRKTPTAMLKLAGSDLVQRKGPRGRRREPRPEAKAPSPPSWLDREARAEWRRVVPRLEAMGVLARTDRAALAIYCQLWSRWVGQVRGLAGEPQTVLSAEGVPKANPVFGLCDRTEGRIRQYLAEFGLSPATRARLVVPEEAQKPVDDPLQALLDRQRTA